MKQELSHIKPGDAIVAISGVYTCPGVFVKQGPSGAIHMVALYPGNSEFWISQYLNNEDKFVEKVKKGWITSYYNVHLSSYQRVYKITQDNLDVLEIQKDYQFVKKTLGL